VNDAVPLVLVHGGAHGAWCWDPLRPHLQTSALAVDLPPAAIRGVPHANPPPEIATVGVDAFASSVLADADAAGLDRFVLVGHSMGGLTIAEIARRTPDRVAHLVFVSCLVPPDGGSTIDALPADLRDMTRNAVEPLRAGGLPMDTLDEATIRRMFCNDMDDRQTAFVLAHCGIEAPSAFVDPVRRADIPPDLPKTYVRLLQDQALTPADQDRQIANLRAVPGGPLDVVELDTGHDVMISAPTHLAPLLDQIARGAATGPQRPNLTGPSGRS
jgi:pimeloyl-ACP methyl ester carboxylesterase